MTILAQHIDDGLGHCRVCRVADQRGSLSWPRVLQESALLAAVARTAAGLPAAEPAQPLHPA